MTTTQLFTAETYVTTVNALSAAITDAAKGVGKLAKMVREVASPAYGDADKQAELATLLGAIKSAVVAQRETYVKYLSSHGRAIEVQDFKKASQDQFTYAVKVAGAAAGCKFVYSKKDDSYSVGEAKAAGEKSENTAAGKDQNSVEQSADIVAAAIAAPVLSAADRAATAASFFRAFVAEGGTVEELERAFHAFTAELAAKAASEELAANNGAGEPKAPAIAAEKLAAEFSTAANGIKVKNQRRAAK